MNAVSGFQSALTGISRGMNALRDDAQVIATIGVTNSEGNIKSPLDQDVTKAIVDLNVSSRQVEASAKVLKTQDEMVGVLLDKLA